MQGPIPFLNGAITRRLLLCMTLLAMGHSPATAIASALFSGNSSATL